MDRTDQLSPLGVHRLRLLDCLGGNSPRTPGYFDVSPGTDIFAAFRQHVAQLSQKWATETDPTTLSLLAAGRLLSGHLDAAEVILNHLPVKAFKLDHGAGFCVVTPQLSLLGSLPLPKELTDINRWLAGSGDQAALQKWLSESQNRLEWDENKGVYQLRQQS